MEHTFNIKYFKIGVLVLALCLSAWLAGCVFFTVKVTTMPQHDPQQMAGAIVVLTGGDGRIDAGLDLFAARRGLYLFITSVHPHITEDSIRGKWGGQSPLPVCCIALDYDAKSTVGNALATKGWIEDVYETSGQRIESVRLVTSNYHMPRALLDFGRIMPDLTLYPHPIASPGYAIDDEAFWSILMTEYHKSILRSAQSLLPLDWIKI